MLRSIIQPWCHKTWRAHTSMFMRQSSIRHVDSDGTTKTQFLVSRLRQRWEVVRTKLQGIFGVRDPGANCHEQPNSESVHTPPNAGYPERLLLERPKDEPYRISRLAECVPIKAHRQRTEKNSSHTFAPFTGLGRAGKVKERPLGLQ